MASKVLTCWLANKTVELANRDGASEADRMLATCVFSYSKLVSCMDGSGFIMTESEAAEFHHQTMRHLRSYVWLHRYGMSMDNRRSLPGKKCFLLLPKLHHLWHLAWDVLQTRLNPKNCLLLSAESFVGEVGRVARACHRSTVSSRTLDRWRAKIALKLEALAQQLRSGKRLPSQAQA